MTTTPKRPESRPPRSVVGPSRNREEHERTSSVEREFGERVRCHRLQRRWTIDDLAARSGVSRAAISKIERGERSTRLGNMVRLAHAFDLQPGRLLDRPVAPVDVGGGGPPQPSSADTASMTTVVRDPTTGVELQLYRIPSYGAPASLARLEPGTSHEVAPCHRSSRRPPRHHRPTALAPATTVISPRRSSICPRPLPTSNSPGSSSARRRGRGWPGSCRAGRASGRPG